MSRLALAGMLVAVLVGACGRPPAAVPAAPAPLAATAAPDAARTTPVRLRIAALGVDSALVALGTDASGALVPPESPFVAGWFAAGPVPGEDGPAVLAGHVDSRTGPGVFYRLGELRPGDAVAVSRADGSTVAFAVSRVTQVAKADFPTQAVYGPSAGPELRLVTCGGSFDRAVGHYRDNVIVEAVPADPPEWTVDG